MYKGLSLYVNCGHYMISGSLLRVYKCRSQYIQLVAVMLTTCNEVDLSSAPVVVGMEQQSIASVLNSPFLVRVWLCETAQVSPGYRDWRQSAEHIICTLYILCLTILKEQFSQ